MIHVARVFIIARNLPLSFRPLGDVVYSTAPGTVKKEYETLIGSQIQATLWPLLVKAFPTATPSSLIPYPSLNG